MSTIPVKVHDDLVHLLLKVLSDYIANGNKFDTTTVIDNVTIDGGSISSLNTFTRNAVTTNVTEDTTTYSNNIPLPTKIVDRSSSDFLKSFKIADIDDAASPYYYGFERLDGKWYILKVDASAKTYRYRSGTSNYATGWSGRASGSAYGLLSTLTW